MTQFMKREGRGGAGGERGEVFSIFVQDPSCAAGETTGCEAKLTKLRAPLAAAKKSHASHGGNQKMENVNLDTLD